MTQNQSTSISVVIPNYNHASYLPECLDSIFSQSVQPEAVYVLDDASTDNSLEILRVYGKKHPHLHILENKKNRGVNANMNSFLQQIHTTHVLFLGADDFLLPGYFGFFQSLLPKHPNAGVCTADVIDLLPNGHRQNPRPQLSSEPAFFSPSRLSAVARGRGMLGQCLYHTEALKQIGGFQEKLRWHADHFACWILSARQGLGYVPKPGGIYRTSDGGYCAAGLNTPAHQQVLADSLEYLNRPEFAEIKPILRDAQVLAIFDEGLFSALWKNSRNRYFLTPSLICVLVKRRLRNTIRHPIPPTVKNWFRPRRKAA